MTAREFSLSFEIAPPSSVRPGQAFTIPVVVSVRQIGTPSGNVLALPVHASLRDEAGTGPATGLSGNLTTSCRDAKSGYVKFSPLTISKAGKYRLRVMLGAASYNGVVTKEYVDSSVITVAANAPAAQRPSGSPFLFLL
ncbi:hypothetical protein N7478_010338 [Penicillium angulare]|uniref:uncharacterized protein n=1 Tax=Penicillium angulare TaxID=116970 RepID=UPI002540E3EC|nr:uncharacterized protein N7478_010338 [Penicillium angulare]KAJ5267530.1 hypothetical protein N7478_010338 [Penicillium angulare]